MASPPLTLLGVLAKFPEPGKVKTRLAAAVGKDRACQLYRSFLLTTLDRFHGTARRSVLAFSPPERQSEFRELLGQRNWELTPQHGDGLGARMRIFFEQGFAQGARRIVLLGSDSPTLPQPYVRQAFEALNEFPVVLGPTDDGGYYLVGAADAAPPIFEGIPFSTDAVWAQTTRRLNEAGLAFATLPIWYDVDDVDDLHRMMGEME